jgi:hypothetical protein
MDLLVIMVILGLVVVFVTSPLRRAAWGSELPVALGAEEDEPELRELEAGRDAKLRELRDAELDHRTGKLSDEDYREVDAALRAEAVEILRELDQAREAGLGDQGRDHESPDTITG